MRINPRVWIVAVMAWCFGLSLGTWIGCEIAWRGCALPTAAWDVDSVIWRVDTVRCVDTVRMPGPERVRIVQASPAPAGDSLRIDVRDDGRLWLRIADTLRRGRWAGRSVDYAWLRPVEMRRVEIRGIPPLSSPPRRGLLGWAPQGPGGPIGPRWGWMLQAGLDAHPAGLSPWVGLGGRYGSCWVGVRAGHRGQAYGGLWVGYQW